MSKIQYGDDHRELPVVKDFGNGLTFSAVNKTRMVDVTLGDTTVRVPWNELISYTNGLSDISVGTQRIVITEVPYQRAPNIEVVGYENLPDPDGSVVAVLSEAVSTYMADMFWKERESYEAQIVELKKQLEAKS